MIVIIGIRPPLFEFQHTNLYTKKALWLRTFLMWMRAAKQRAVLLR